MTIPVRRLVLPTRVLPSVQKPVEAQERYMTKLVTEHPRIDLILASMREGVAATQIAAYMAKEGLITVNEKTFTDALRMYKRKHPEAIAQDANDSVSNIDKIADPNRPHVDLEDQLQQLLRLQRIRVGLSAKTELEMGVLFNNTHKEIQTAIDAIETLAKIKGKISDGSGRMHAPEDAGVLENLSQIKKEQGVRDQLHQSIKKLVEVKT